MWAWGAGAAFGALPDLRGERFYIQSDVPETLGSDGYLNVTSKACNADGSGHISFEAHGPTTAMDQVFGPYGPYPGTYTESGSATWGPRDASGNGPLTSLSTHFTITAGTAAEPITIDGFRTLPSSGPVLVGRCNLDGFEFVLAAMNPGPWEATITSPTETCEVSGEGSWFVLDHPDYPFLPGRPRFQQFRSDFEGPPDAAACGGLEVLRTPVGEQESVTTGSSPTPTDPVETTIQTPNAGVVTISESTAGSAPQGYSFLGQQVVITAPDATVDTPLRLTFALDASLIPATGADTVAILRDGTEAQACAGGGVAVPDPCIESRDLDGNGDLVITVLTSHASTWTVGVVKYVFTGFFPPVDNAPTVNRVAAGSAVPVAFSLGRDAGLAVFAAGSPSSRSVACSTGAPVDDIEQTVTSPGSSTLTYQNGRYRFVWKTDRSWAGMCRTLTLKFKDGTLKTAQFQLR